MDAQDLQRMMQKGNPLHQKLQKELAKALSPAIAECYEIQAFKIDKILSRIAPTLVKIVQEEMKQPNPIAAVPDEKEEKKEYET